LHIFELVVGVATIIGTVFAVLQYMKPKEATVDKNNRENKTFNVKSFNQQGGITAGEVNIGSIPRTFNQQVAASLQPHLPLDKNKTIRITSVMGDQEAFQFAEQIKKYLLSQKWKVVGVDQAVYSGPVIGQIVEPKQDGGLEIIIGGKQ